MNSSDPASLQNLNDIVLPPGIGWWPLAPGWYTLAVILLAVLAWFSYRSLQRWLRNRYRREALQNLALLEQGLQDPEQRNASLRQLPALLKRAALSAYPRSEVASLSGKAWHDFLNSRVKNTLFDESTLITLDKVAYSSGDLSNVDAQAAASLFEASKGWLKNHCITAGDDIARGSR